MQNASKPAPGRWIRVRLPRLAWLVYDAPAGLRWHWRKVPGPRGARLQVVSARGTVWNFKLNGGAWLQKNT